MCIYSCADRHARACLRLAGALLLLLRQPAVGLDNGLGLSGPAMGWSSWNHFGNNGSHCHCFLGASGLMEIADVFVSSGLRDAGYRYINMVRLPQPLSGPPSAVLAACGPTSERRRCCGQDGGWAIERSPTTGELVPDPYQFPQGIKPVADYVHAKGLLFGICDRPACRPFGLSVLPL